MSSELCQQAIRELAYHKWEQAGCPQGDGCNFWLEAELELSSCQQKQVPTEQDCCDESLKIVSVSPAALKKAG